MKKMTLRVRVKEFELQRFDRKIEKINPNPFENLWIYQCNLGTINQVFYIFQ